MTNETLKDKYEYYYDSANFCRQMIEALNKHLEPVKKALEYHEENLRKLEKMALIEDLSIEIPNERKYTISIEKGWYSY